MERLYVRCCCQPTVIMGTLPYVGGGTYRTRIGRMKFGSDGAMEVDSEIIEIPQEVYYNDAGKPELAYKAHDLDLLRQIRDFVPINSDNATTAADRSSAIRAGEVAASDGDFVCPVTVPSATQEDVMTAPKTSLFERLKNIFRGKSREQVIRENAEWRESMNGLPMPTKFPPMPKVKPPKTDYTPIYNLCQCGTLLWFEKERKAGKCQKCLQ